MEFMQCHFDNSVFCEEPYCEHCFHNPPAEQKKNGKAEPVNLIWENDYDGGVFPKCPSCGEMPYDLHTCFFCGQRFLNDEIVEEWEKPPVAIEMDCPVCGAKNAMVGVRAKNNGHFHGKCENCGARIIE